MVWRSAFRLNIFLLFLFSAIAQHGFAAGSGGLKKRRDFLKHTHTVVNAHFDKYRVVIKFRDSDDIHLRGQHFIAPDTTDFSAFNALTRPLPGFKLSRLFARSEDELSQARDEAEQTQGVTVADPNLFFILKLPDSLSNGEVAGFVDALNRLDIVETAYLQPNPRQQSVDIPPQTPDYEVKQAYLGNAPGGLNWRSVYSNHSSYPGVLGDNVRLADIEHSWNLNHEDLKPPLFIDGTLPAASAQDDHGTAVLGIMLGQDNGYGITGIVPNAAYGVVTTNARNVASAIDSAATYLSAGDVINLSIGFYDSRGYAVPVEYYAAEYTAIQLAVAKGIIVVECASNGYQDGGQGANLDDSFYQGVFNRNVRDSGAIIVGAAEMGGLDHRYAALYSNYGSRVDSFAWGNGVTTAGYGDLFHADANQMYMDSGWGTSFSAPMVAGIAAAIESYYRQLTGNVLSPWQLRALLTTTGTAAGNRNHYIGTMPNLQEALDRIQSANGLIFDSDHDGLLDADEAALGTDPDKMDSDGDGISDSDELRFYHTDPNRAGASLSLPRNQGYNTLTVNQFQWVDVPGEDYYQLYLYDTSSGGVVINNFLLEANICAKGICNYSSSVSLADGHQYMAWLYTYPKASISGGWSAESGFESWTSLPAVPVILAPMPAAAVSWKPSYSWTSQPGATGYAISVYDGSYYRTNTYSYITPAEAGCANGEPTCRFTLLQYDNSDSTGLAQGSYSWFITARNPFATAASAWNQGMTVSLATPIEVSPISPVNLAVTGGLPVFTWQSTPQANYYWLDVTDGAGMDYGYIYVGADYAGCANGEPSCTWQPKGYGASNLQLPSGGNSQWCIWASNAGGIAPGRCGSFRVQ